MPQEVTPELSSSCERCGSDNSVNKPVVIPTPTSTYTVGMCMNCRLELVGRDNV